jgi:adenosine deaminase CECR1
LEAIAAENVQVLELRAFLGGPMDLDGKSSGAESALSLYRQFLSETREKYPDFQLKIIYTWARAASPDSVSKKLQTALELRRKYPDFVVGFDIVNEEDRSHPLIDFLNSFLETMRAERASRVKLPYFLHAGESNRTENENLFDALLLNSKRIGHGLALIKHPLLLNLVRQRRIPIEVCPISNQVLGYIADLRNHPAVNWLRSGIPVTINPDDPGMMGYTFSYDFYEAFMAWDLDLADLKQLAMNSLRYSSLDSTEKALAMRSWKVKWYTFVTWLNSRSR